MKHLYSATEIRGAHDPV